MQLQTLGCSLLKKKCALEYIINCVQKGLDISGFAALANTPNVLNILSNKSYFCLVTCCPILASSSWASLSCVREQVGEWGQNRE